MSLSTLNRLELMPAAGASDARQHKLGADPGGVDRLLVQQFTDVDRPAAAGMRAGTAALAQMGLDDAQHAMQHGADRPRLALPLFSIGQRSRLGTERTHWRAGNGGKT